MAEILMNHVQSINVANQIADLPLEQCTFVPTDSTLQNSPGKFVVPDAFENAVRSAQWDVPYMSPLGARWELRRTDDGVLYPLEQGSEPSTQLANYRAALRNIIDTNTPAPIASLPPKPSSGVQPRSSW